MSKATTLTEAQLKLFSNDFFGRLIVEARPGQERSYFEGDSPDDAPWEPWKVVSEDGDVFQIESKGTKPGTLKETTIRLEGNCYMVEQPHLGFGEWFCKI